MSHSVTIPARHSWRRPALGVSTAAVAAAILALAVGLRGPTPTHAPAQAPRIDRTVPVLSGLGDTTGLRRGGLATSDQGVATLRGDPGRTS